MIETDDRLQNELTAQLQLFRERNLEYGDNWKSLGALAMFVEMNAKWARLHHAIWEGKGVYTRDQIRDWVRDLNLYGDLLLFCLEDGNLFGENFDGDGRPFFGYRPENPTEVPKVGPVFEIPKGTYVPKPNHGEFDR